MQNFSTLGLFMVGHFCQGFSQCDFPHHDFSHQDFFSIGLSLWRFDRHIEFEKKLLALRKIRRKTPFQPFQPFQLDSVPKGPEVVSIVVINPSDKLSILAQFFSSQGHGCPSTVVEIAPYFLRVGGLNPTRCWSSFFFFFRSFVPYMFP